MWLLKHNDLDLLYIFDGFSSIRPRPSTTAILSTHTWPQQITYM